MNLTILYHIMPWEIDYCLLTYTQLKKSKYFINSDVKITIYSVLNLSNHLINWDESRIKKDFFIEKYKFLSNLLVDYNHINKIYDGDELYGHLDLQKECINTDADYYLCLTPDMYFGPKAITYLLESTKFIKNKYFVITPQISKFWDDTWNILTHPKFYEDVSHAKWYTRDVFDIVSYNEHTDREIFLTQSPVSKFAGWFDLYNKAFYEEICNPFPEWNGYGGWDYYSILLTTHLKNQIDFQQYILNNELIFEYSVGPLYGAYRDGFSEYYKSQIKINVTTQNQTRDFEKNIPFYLTKKLKELKDNNIIL